MDKIKISWNLKEKIVLSSPCYLKWSLIMNEIQTLSQSDLTPEALNHFIGSQCSYQHPLVKTVTYTEGVKFVGEAGQAYWLIDDIAIAQGEPLVAKNEFQVWTLTVNPDHSAILICQDGNNDKPIHSIQYSYTDFPMEQTTLYFYNETILLPTE